MKLWDKGIALDAQIEAFTIGKDRELDLYLAPYDILGTIAHIRMLCKAGMLGEEELNQLLPALRELHASAVEGTFAIEPGIEDVHSQVELELTRRLGAAGRSVHTGRSRNDQILLDIKLFARAHIERTVGKVKRLFDLLQEKSEAHKEVLLPGYTHLQVAMPSSFGLWFGAYAESLSDDLVLIKAAWDLVNHNPLGSAAGYGSSAPIDRELTTRLLGFADLDCNSVYAQMTRGRTEWTVASAYASLASSVGRFAMDCCLYSSQNFGFIRLPDPLTTGSSIMPHKKNPDVFELVRARCNCLQGIPGSIRNVTGNLPSGYFRDMQVLKELFLPLFDEMDGVLDIVCYAVSEMTLQPDLMDNPLYRTAFSVEEVNRLAAQGVPFRDAYRQVGEAIQRGDFTFRTGKPLSAGNLGHTHIGSLGNLGNDRIAAKMQRTLDAFGFDKVRAALEALLQ